MVEYIKRYSTMVKLLAFIVALVLVAMIGYVSWSKDQGTWNSTARSQSELEALAERTRKSKVNP
jgi:predicted negative regulator of RcsB-dependent stress response